MIKTGMILVLLICMTNITYSQNQMDKSAYYKFGKRLYFVFTYNYNPQSDSVEVTTFLKIPYMFLRFEKDKNSKIESFISKPRIELEFIDTNDIIRKRESLELTISTKNYSELNNKDKFYYNKMTTKLPAHVFQPQIRLYDNEKTKLMEKKLNKIKLNDLKNGKNSLPPIMTSKNNSTDTSSRTIQILEGNANFSSNDLDILIPYYDNSKPSKLNYSIEYLDTKNTFPGWENNIKVNGQIFPQYDQSINITFDENNNPSIKLQKVKLDSTPSGLLEIFFNADKTVPGNYVLNIWKDKSKDTIRLNFAIEWENMPLSLRNPEYACEMMYYILTDDEYNSMKSGSSKEILKKIFEYWKTKDPTKFTIYNETMYEYFRRVDQAFYNYQTFNEKDGAKTERGKIFILNGTPDLVVRDINREGKPLEKWTYNRLKKVFTFDSDPSGTMFVSSVDDIK